jgi:hypothetical protein
MLSKSNISILISLLLTGCVSAPEKASEFGMWSNNGNITYDSFYLFTPARQDGPIQTPAYYTNLSSSNFFIKRDESFFDAGVNSNKPAYFIKAN